MVHITDLNAALIVGGDIGFIDVADLARLGMEQIAINLELPADRQQVAFRKGTHGLASRVARSLPK